MSRRMILPLIFGVAGTAVLLALGFWQLQRHEWKQTVLADIEARMGGTPVAIPSNPDSVDDLYRPVVESGVFVAPDLRVLVSSRDTGAAYRLISAFVIEDGRRILVDRGLLPVEDTPTRLDGVAATVTGNLHWPDEIDSFTPEPDLAGNIWFARDVPALAGALDADPILVVARQIEGIDVAANPLPVGTENIPDSHFGYAVQWFGMAAVWMGMTVFLLWRIRQRTV